MKINKSHLVMALAIVAFNLTSLQLLAQACVSCFSDKSNVTIGYNNNVSSSWEKQSILGNNNTTSRNNAVAIGTNSTASWSHSYVFGSNSASNGIHSYAIGSNSIAQSSYSFAIGYSAKSMFGNALTVGNFTLSDAVGACVFGLGVSPSIPLVNNVGYSLAIGFKSTKPTVFVSESPYSANSDLTGKVGIGNVTAPQAKLHIRGDVQEDATLRLEATGNDKHSRLLFTDDHFISAKNDDHFRFNTSEDKTFLFHNGDIYIEDISKGIIMKSPNGQCWRGTVNDQGMLVFAQTDCPDQTPSIINQPTSGSEVKIYPNPTNGSIIIESLPGITNANWMLTALDGALLMSGKITSDKMEISLAHFVAGIYMLSIEHNGHIIKSEKVVKQ